MVKDKSNPLLDKLNQLLYDLQRILPPSIAKSERNFHCQDYTIKEESVQIILGIKREDHIKTDVPKPDDEGVYGIGRLVLSTLDYWEYNSLYEGELLDGVPHGFGRLITSKAESIIGYFD